MQRVLVAMPGSNQHILGMVRLRLVLFVFALSLPAALSNNTSLAQNNNTGNTEAAVPDQPKIKVLPPAYENQMLRLSEILGALHYLRDLCGANEGQLWREQMQNMLKQEEPTAERRAMLIARFNRGFRGFQETYRECTDAAIEANNRYIFEGTRLAGEIPGRYGR